MTNPDVSNNEAIGRRAGVLAIALLVLGCVGAGVFLLRGGSGTSDDSVASSTIETDTIPVAEPSATAAPGPTAAPDPTPTTEPEPTPKPTAKPQPTAKPSPTAAPKATLISPTPEPAQPVIDLPGTGKTATMGRANWASGYIQAQILHNLLEEIGYDVSSPDGLEFAADLGYEAMASGEMDFWANSWYPGHLSWWEGTLPDGTRIGNNLERLEGSLMPGGGLQGMLITKSWAEDSGITTLDQINGDEALWSQLDSDGNGKGEFYGCPDAWTCDDIMESQIVFAGWDSMEQISIGYDAMFFEFLTKAQAGEPAIIYTWAPTSYLAQALPGETTMWLSFNTTSVLDDSNPLGYQDGAAYDQRPGYSGLGADTCLQGPDGCQTGWAAADIEITANRAWLDDNPAARALFGVFAPPMIDLAIAGAALDASSGRQSDVESIAARWIADNRSLADQWIATALAGA